MLEKLRLRKRGFYNENAAFCNQFAFQLFREYFNILQIKSAKPEVGSDLWADRRELQSEMKARNCAVRANIAQYLRLYIHADCRELQSEIKARSCAVRASIANFLRLYIRTDRPEVGPYLGCLDFAPAC
jgi:hypothetical protein